MPDLRSEIEALADEWDEWNGSLSDMMQMHAQKLRAILARYPAENGWRDVTGRAAEARLNTDAVAPGTREIDGRIVQCDHCRAAWMKGEREHHWHDCTKPVEEVKP